MLTFCGTDLELAVNAGSDPRRGPALWSAFDSDGGYWLVLEADRYATCVVWLCAPITVKALDAVRFGRATPRDAFRHSATGTVELIATDGGRALPDRRMRCQDVPEHLLPPADWHLDARPGYGEVVHAERRARPRRPADSVW